MKEIIRNILLEEIRTINEGYKEIILGLATFLSLGLSKMNAQEIKNNQPKLHLVKTLADYNKNPQGGDTLKSVLLPKMGNKTDYFIKNFIEFKPDKTIIVKPNFIDGLKLDFNPRSKDFGFTYTLKF